MGDGGDRGGKGGQRAREAMRRGKKTVTKGRSLTWVKGGGLRKLPLTFFRGYSQIAY